MSKIETQTIDYYYYINGADGKVISALQVRAVKNNR